MKFQNTFLVNFQKSSLIFKAGFENEVTFLKTFMRSIFKFHEKNKSWVKLVMF